MPVLSEEQSVHDLIAGLGYRLTEDDWDRDGRRTYIHDEAFALHLKELKSLLQPIGWHPSSDELWILKHSVSGQILEFEPGGADVSGHFLHHLK
jgi:hypothetical protein